MGGLLSRIKLIKYVDLYLAPSHIFISCGFWGFSFFEIFWGGKKERREQVVFSWIVAEHIARSSTVEEFAYRNGELGGLFGGKFEVNAEEFCAKTRDYFVFWGKFVIGGVQQFVIFFFHIQIEMFNKLAIYKNEKIYFLKILRIHWRTPCLPNPSWTELFFFKWLC